MGSTRRRRDPGLSTARAGPPAMSHVRLRSVAVRARQLATQARSRVSGLRDIGVDYAAMRPPWGSAERVRAFSQMPADELFITGNGIAARCRHILNYDVLTSNERGRESWWFCKADYLDFFFSELAPEEPFTLFTHNSDRPIDRRYRGELDNQRLVAWFAQNAAFHHAKLWALPVGIANPVWQHGDQAALERIQRERPDKTRLFDVSFNPETNLRERRRCLAATGLEVSSRLPYEMYLRRLASAHFCISPNGNGIDCHRTWEALYVRTIPVVTRSLVTDQHRDLPMVVLDDWSQFSGVDFSPLLYERIWANWDPAALRLDRYFERIEQRAASCVS
jgi:hypothetical protein